MDDAHQQSGTTAASDGKAVGKNYEKRSLLRLLSEPNFEMMIVMTMSDDHDDSADILSHVLI